MLTICRRRPRLAPLSLQECLLSDPPLDVEPVPLLLDHFVIEDLSLLEVLVMEESFGMMHKRAREAGEQVEICTLLVLEAEDFKPCLTGLTILVDTQRYRRRYKFGAMVTGFFIEE